MREGFLWILQGRHSIVVDDAYRLHDNDDDVETYLIGKCAVKSSCRQAEEALRLEAAPETIARQ